MKKVIGILVIIVVLALGAPALLAQEHGAASQPATSQEHQQGEAQSGEQHPQNPNVAMGEQLAKESKEAAGEGGEHAEFKQSAAVKWFARVTGLSVEAAYWVAICLNFLILAGLIWWFSKGSVPAALRNRTASIQKGIEDARKASEEAQARLGAVEGRLAKLDTEVEELRASAEADFKQEEARIRESAEEDAQRVIESAEQEIAAAAKNARRELTAYAADLAVDLAGKKIQVSDSVDEALVNRFVSQLGKDGK